MNAERIYQALRVLVRKAAVTGEREAMLCSIFKWELVTTKPEFIFYGDGAVSCALCCRFKSVCVQCPVVALLEHRNPITGGFIRCGCTHSPFGLYATAAHADQRAKEPTASEATKLHAAAELAFLIEVFQYSTGETFDNSMLDPLRTEFNNLLAGAKP